MRMFSKKRIRNASALPGCLQLRNGFTLVELIVVVAIVGILAAIGIPSFMAYIKNSRISEAQGNIQGIIEAEQVYFTRFQRYTPNLPVCPPVQAAAGKAQIFDPALCVGNVPTEGWVQLGWMPDGAVYFQYQVFSAYPDDFSTNANAVLRSPLTMANATLFGVNWNESMVQAQPSPWFAIEAKADTDGDTRFVFMRSNSVNYKVHREPDPSVNPTY